MNTRKNHQRKSGIAISNNFHHVLLFKMKKLLKKLRMKTDKYKVRWKKNKHPSLALMKLAKTIWT